MDKESVGKLIKERRKELKISQQTLCAGICNRSALSRIESGELSVSAEVMSQLLERIGLYDESFYGLGDKDDGNVRRIIRSANQLCVNGDTTGARELLNSIETDFDNFSLPNRQRFEVLDTMILYNNGVIDEKKRLNNLEKSLRLTVKDYNVNNLPMVMTKMEVQILKYIATTYGAMNDYDTASTILSHVKSRLEEVIFDDTIKARTLISICYNLSKSLGLAEMYDDSIAVAEDGIKYCEYINNIGALPSCIYNLAWSTAHRNGQGDKERALKLANEALLLCTPKTRNHEELSSLIRNLIEELND